VIFVELKEPNPARGASPTNDPLGPSTV
jgi:hypothetical protein